MADRPKRSRKPKKPLSEIEAAIADRRQLFLSSWRGLRTMIMAIGNLHIEERNLLLNAASDAQIKTFDYLGYLPSSIREKHNRMKMSGARSPKSARAIFWHDEAKKLAIALWEKRPDLRGNASSTSTIIHKNLEKSCSQENPPVKAPKAETIAKHLSGLS
jgi:hypothetical protein